MTQFVMELKDKGLYQILSFDGRLDLQSIHASSIEIKEVPLKHTLVDCTALEFVDSSGLGMLASLFQRLKQLDQKLILIMVPSRILSILQRTHLDTLFIIAENEEQALNHFN
jgi:anti-anti-sigma factor